MKKSVVDIEQRPPFKKMKSYEEFRLYYWYREELVKICRDIGIDASGHKLDLEKRIEQYFKGESRSPNRISSPKKYPFIPIDRVTVETPLLHCKFAFNSKFRQFFGELVGVDRFKFTADMAAASRKAKLLQDESFTIGDLLDIYYGNSDYARYDSKACEWNKFYSDFCADCQVKAQFNNPLKVASILWGIVRDGIGEKCYSRDLVLNNMESLQAYIVQRGSEQQ